MSRCPKCGGSSISGPHYENGNYCWHRDGEALRYTCACGYSETRPCHDAKPKHELLPAYGHIGKPETTDGEP